MSPKQLAGLIYSFNVISFAAAKLYRAVQSDGRVSSSVSSLHGGGYGQGQGHKIYECSSAFEIFLCREYRSASVQIALLTS